MDATLPDLKTGSRPPHRSSSPATSSRRDAIGSALATGLLLEKHGKRFVVVNRDPVPESLAFSRAATASSAPGAPVGADLFIVLDSAGADASIPRCVPWPREPRPRSISTTTSATRASATSPTSIPPPLARDRAARLPTRRHRRLAARCAIGENLLAAISTDTRQLPLSLDHGRDDADRRGDPRARRRRRPGHQMHYENYPARRVEALRVLLQGCGSTSTAVAPA